MRNRSRTPPRCRQHCRAPRRKHLAPVDDRWIVQRGDDWSDVAGPQRVLLRRWRDLDNADRQIATGYRTDGDNTGDFVDYQFRIGYHPGVRRMGGTASAATTAATAATAGCTAESSADSAGSLRTMHDRSRQDGDGHRRCTRSGWRHVDLSMDRSIGHVCRIHPIVRRSGRRQSRRGRCRPRSL